MSKRFSILLVILVIISGLIGGAISGRVFAVKPAMAVDESLWGDDPANVTNSEYLSMLFSFIFHEHVSSESISEYTIAIFFPSVSPQNAVLYVRHACNEKLAKGDTYYLKQVIRKYASSYVRLFETNMETPEVYKRWIVLNPRNHIIIRHVRARDTEETLAVTMDGITSFNEEDFEKAKQRVELAWGVW